MSASQSNQDVVVNEFPCRVGICKECIEYVQLIKKNQIILNGVPQEIWECPECNYPNHITDFLAVDDSLPPKIINGDGK